MSQCPRASDKRLVFPNMNMLIRTTTLWGRYPYHHHLRYKEVKLRNSSPEFTFLATMAMIDFPRFWSTLQLEMY